MSTLTKLSQRRPCGIITQVIMIFIIILTAIPILIWSLMMPIPVRFGDLNSLTTSLGQIFGLIGMVLFSVNLILAGRFKFIDKYFKGLDKVYQNHSKIGTIAFSLILFHPILLVVTYVTFSLRDAALFFVPFINIPITFGILSLLLMIVLIAFTFYIKMKYHIWKFSHKFMTLAFSLAVLHILYIPSDISRNNFLRYYILVLAMIGLVVSVRQAFFNKFIKNKFKYKILKVNKMKDSFVEVEMEPSGEVLKFNSGQFAFFEFLNSKVGSESHPFSISSSDNDNNLKITVKDLGDFTSKLGSLDVGGKVLVDGPYGGFSYRSAKNKNQIWIAGGVGITPFFSMAQSLGDDYGVDLYYSVRDDKEEVYFKELREIASRRNNFKFNPWVSSLQGYINARFISGLSNGFENKEIFLCGPASFMESLKNQLVSLGVDIKRIHYENFSF